jgi:hypothetical protein
MNKFKKGDRVHTTRDLGNGEWVGSSPILATVEFGDDEHGYYLDFDDDTGGNYDSDELVAAEPTPTQQPPAPAGTGD